MFKMRILITLLMLLKCSIDDVITGYVDLRVIIPATVVGAGVFSAEDIILGRGTKRLWIYLVVILCGIVGELLMCMIRNYYSLLNDTDNVYYASELTDKNKCQFANKYMFIGTGDLIVFVSITAIMGLEIMATTAFIAFFISSIYSIYLIIVKHVGIHDGFPFMPFILMGFILESI